MFISFLHHKPHQGLFNIQTRGGGQIPASSQLCPPSEEVLDLRKYPFLYRFSAMLSNNYCLHRVVVMNGTPRVSSAKEWTTITFLHNIRKLCNTRTLRYCNNFKTRDFISKFFYVNTWHLWTLFQYIIYLSFLFQIGLLFQTGLALNDAVLTFALK